MKGLDLLDVETELNEYYEGRCCNNCKYDNNGRWCFDCCNFSCYVPKK